MTAPQMHLPNVSFGLISWQDTLDTGNHRQRFCNLKLSAAGPSTPLSSCPFLAAHVHSML